MLDVIYCMFSEYVFKPNSDSKSSQSEEGTIAQNREGENNNSRKVGYKQSA